MSFKDNFKEGTGWSAAAQALPAILGLWQASKAKTDYKNKITEIEEFQRQGIVNPYQNLENPYKNLSVATQAARMQAEEADIALANTLDTLRATGKGAGGATALAQAALRSKKDISANIEQQEVANEKLKAQGQLEVDKAKAKGEYLRATMQEAREIGELDRLQGQADLARAQQLQSQYGAISALGSGLSTLAGGVLPPQQLADGELSKKELRQQRRANRNLNNEPLVAVFENDNQVDQPYRPRNIGASGGDDFFDELNTGNNKYAALLKSADIASQLF